MRTAEKAISGGLAGKRLITDTKLASSRFLKISRKNTRGVEDGKEVAQEEKREWSKQLLRNSSLSTWPAFH